MPALSSQYSALLRGRGLRAARAARAAAKDRRLTPPVVASGGPGGETVMVDAVVFGMRKSGAACAAVLVWGALIALLAVPALAADEIRGEANVISGNEIVVGKKTIRLFGVSAPDLKETCDVNEAKIKCGIVAWAELIKLADGQLISCDHEDLPEGAPATDKTVEFGSCYIGETDLNEAMVRSGWANAVLEQTDRYEVDEADAKESGRGLWSNGGKGRHRH
jgi:endonuclease YncB( thermonuclease family)